MTTVITRFSRRPLLAALPAAVALIGAAGVSGGPAAHASLPYGPYTCKQGFVWREAFGGDFVCVKPEVRTRVQQDNSQAAARRGPGAYGPDTCKNGFVWREARSSDHVCVTPDQREQATNDNRQSVWRLQDATQLPQGGAGISTVRTSRFDSQLFAHGSSFTPNSYVHFYAVGRTNLTGAYSTGSAATDQNGAFSRGLIAHWSCDSYQVGPVTVVAVDTSTGAVTKAGVSNAWTC